VKTGIIVALADEITSLTRKKINKGDCFFINDNVLVAFSGAGPKNAAKASQLLIDKGANRLISWGCAAALKAELKPGDLLIPQTLQTENLEKFSISSPWLCNVLEHLSPLNPHTDSLIESSYIVTQSSAKKKIHQQSGAIALDMESIAIAKTALQHNFPALIIRCVADPVTMNLPNAISYALNGQGDVVLTRLLWFLLIHPYELPGLIKLGLHFNVAKNKLKCIAKQLDIITGFEQKTVVK
jgi:nucleoside phosphorylase